MKALLTSSLALALALAGHPASGELASDAARARELHDDGVRLFAEGRYAEAAESFAAAEGLAPNPLNLYNQARCHQETGELERAETMLERYLGSPGLSAEDQAAAERLRAEIRAASAPGAVPRPEREASPAERPAEDGPEGEATWPTAAGHLGAEPADREGAPSLGATALLQAPEPDLAPSPALEVRAGRARSTGPWSLLGSGLALLLAGGVLDVVAYVGSDPARYDQLGSVDEWASWRDEVRGTAVAGDVLVGIGAAVAVAGVAWLVVSHARRGRSSAAPMAAMALGARRGRDLAEL